jgi:hypothetical protein
MVSEFRPKPSAASPQGELVSARNHDGSSGQPHQEQAMGLTELLRLLDNKEKRFQEQIKEQIREQAREHNSEMSEIKDMIRTLLNQTQPITSTTVANQSSPNASINIAHNHTSVVNMAMSSSNKKKEKKKKKPRVPAPVIAANTNKGKGKGKQIVHATVAPVDTEPQYEIKRAERELEQKATKKNSPLGLAPVRPSHKWLLGGQ